MKGINSVTLLGTLGKDPEVRYTQSGTPVASISVATEARYKDKRTGEGLKKTSWHSCTAFGKVAELIQQYCKKGQNIYIDGALDYQNYEKDGRTIYVTKVTIRDFVLIGGGSQKEPSGENNNKNGNQYQHSTNIDDSNIPF